eukprot:1641533-Prymnesium_polylepis.1
MLSSHAQLSCSALMLSSHTQLSYSALTLSTSPLPSRYLQAWAKSSHTLVQFKPAQLDGKPIEYPSMVDADGEPRVHEG